MAWMPVMVPVVTPLLKDLAFRCQGKWVVLTVKVRLSGPVQVLKPSDVIEPMPVPDSPLPFLTVPLPLEVLQVSVLPVLVSFSVVDPGLGRDGPAGLDGPGRRDPGVGRRERGAGGQGQHPGQCGAGDQNAAGALENRHWLFPSP